jgi:glycerol-1-phosphate dehydrogenase [NAD(P)+]
VSGSAVDDLHDLRERLRTAPDAASIQPIGLREIVHGDGALLALADVVSRAGVARDSSLTVLSDATSKRYGEGDVLDTVLDVLRERFTVELEILTASASGAVLADEATVANAVHAVRQRAPVGLVSVGSGTVTDIAKVLAQELSLPHVVVQTAASVNGFSDDQSVLLIDGAKRTTPSRWPDSLVIDADVIANAPLAMTRSGLGDQLSMFSAAADWYLADAVGFDTSYAPTLVSVMRDGVDDLISNSADLGEGKHSAVCVLADCLARGGLAMGAAGRTAPSSGLEHTISHLLEMHADANAELSASHGSQVGVSSVVAAIVWRRVQQRLIDGVATLNPQNVATQARVLEAFANLDPSGATALECWRLYGRKSRWIVEHLNELADVINRWGVHVRDVDELLAPVGVIAAALRDAKAPVVFRQLNPAPDPAVVTWALTNCHLLRDRFSIVDLADLIGAWEPDDVAAVLHELEEFAS